MIFVVVVDRKGTISAFCRNLEQKKLQKGFRQFRQKHRKNRKGQFLQKGAISAERASFCKINIYRKRPFLQKISAFGQFLFFLPFLVSAEIGPFPIGSFCFCRNTFGRSLLKRTFRESEEWNSLVSQNYMGTFRISGVTSIPLPDSETMYTKWRRQERTYFLCFSLKLEV